ncbi:MAG TPA: CHAT domain-containing protein [Kofleriaceae bacterium]|jgi:hypothetical protein|nr:CHAT domain-containing protein [Kofleriaceae bacterium]
MKKVVIHAGTIGTNIAADVVHIGSPQPLAAPPPVCMLMLAANPPPTARLRIDEEVRSIDQAIQRGRHRERFQLAAQWAVRAIDLQHHLLRYRPAVVHFSGHGEAGALVLEDDAGGAQPLQPDQLAGLFAQLGQHTRCALLSACYTQLQAEAIARHVPCVIGMSHAVSDLAAIAFSIGFYEALVHGESIKTAFELGCQRFALAGDAGRHRDVQDVRGITPCPAPILLGTHHATTIRFC